MVDNAIQVGSESPMGLDDLALDLPDSLTATSCPAKVPFTVHDADTANWVVRRITQARAYAEHVAEWAEAEKRRAAAEEQRLFYLYGAQLRAWAKAELERIGNRRKSLALPGGQVGFRHQDAKVVIEDEDAVLIWCHAHLPAAVNTTETLLKSALVEHIEGTGELPDSGAHLEPETEKFYIR